MLSWILEDVGICILQSIHDSNNLLIITKIFHCLIPWIIYSLVYKIPIHLFPVWHLHKINGLFLLFWNALCLISFKDLSPVLYEYSILHLRKRSIINVFLLFLLLLLHLILFRFWNPFSDFHYTIIVFRR